MIRVVVLADSRLYRESLAECIGLAAGIDVVAAAPWSESRQLAEREQPDVLLADMDTSEGIPGVRLLAAARSRPKVLALAASEAEEEVLAYAEAGVSGYVTRDQSLDEVVRAVRCVANDEAPCSARIAATLLRRLAALSGGARTTGRARLTAREVEVVDLIDAGLTNREIARDLCIEVATVKNHVHNILEKLHVRRRSDAAAVVRGTGSARPARGI